MKFLTFILTPALVGLFLSSNVNSSTLNSQEELGCTNWSHYISCGQDFYLCQDNYDSVEEEVDFAQEMHDLRCN